MSMTDVIASIQKDTAFNKEQLEAHYQTALNRYQDHVQVEGIFPPVLEEVNRHLDSGYIISPMHVWNNQKAGFLCVAMRKPHETIKQEQAALRVEVEQNYRESLERLREKLITDAVEAQLQLERDEEIQRLKSLEVAREEAIRAELIKGIK